MKKLERVFTAIIAGLILFTHISCGGTYHDPDHIPVTIKEFESYAITDIDELEATLIYTGESTDNTVATLLQGKWIYGNSEGAATITITDENTDTQVIYDVTVEHNPDNHFEPVVSEDRNLKDEDADDILPEHMGYIGYCYNVFSGNEFDQSAVAGMKQIFDWDNKVDFNYFSIDTTPSSSANFYSEKSKTEYIEAVEKKYSAQLSAKFLGHTLYTKTWSKNSAEEFKESSYSSRNQIYFQFGQISYALGNKDCTNLGYYNYLKDDVKKALDSIKTYTDVEAFINNYGTHVAVETVLGKSFEADFALKNENVLQKDQFWWDKHFELSIFVNTDFYRHYYKDSKTYLFFEHLRLLTLLYENGDRKYQNIDQIRRAGLVNSIQSHLKMFGGPIDGIEYYDKLTAKQIEANMMYWLYHNKYKVLISTKNKPEKSLVPIYELIPVDTQEGKNRKELFIDYLESKKEK